MRESGCCRMWVTLDSWGIRFSFKVVSAIRFLKSSRNDIANSSTRVLSNTFLYYGARQIIGAGMVLIEDREILRLCRRGHSILDGRRFVGGHNFVDGRILGTMLDGGIRNIRDGEAGDDTRQVHMNRTRISPSIVDRNSMNVRTLGPAHDIAEAGSCEIEVRRSLGWSEMDGNRAQAPDHHSSIYSHFCRGSAIVSDTKNRTLGPSRQPGFREGILSRPWGYPPRLYRRHSPILSFRVPTP